MKTIAILILLTICALSAGQWRNEHYRNSLQGTFKPESLGSGIRGTHYFTNHMGAYASFSSGKHIFVNDNYIKHDYAYALGCSIYIRDCELDPDMSRSFTIGIIHHSFIDSNLDPDFIDISTFNEYSFELGAGLDIGHFSFNFNADILNPEMGLSFGYAF